MMESGVAGMRAKATRLESCLADPLLQCSEKQRKSRSSTFVAAVDKRLEHPSSSLLGHLLLRACLVEAPVQAGEFQTFSSQVV